MLSLEECRSHLKGDSISDEELLELRNNLYMLISGIIDNHFNAELDKFDI